MNATSFDKNLKTLLNVLLAVFAALFFYQAYLSLNWRMELDTPLLHYAAFLIDKYDFVPYRDIFETSMPGTFAFHYFVVKLFGYGDKAFRFVDLTLLGILLLSAGIFMRRFGRSAALWAPVLFGLLYLSKGQTMSLQRDYIGIIPVALSLIAIPQESGKPVSLFRFALIGFLFGASMLIKPHLVIAFPIIFGTLFLFRGYSKERSLSDFFLCLSVSALSLLLPVVYSLFWLSERSALSSFFDLAFNYLPLHNSISGSLQTISGIDRLIYSISQTFQFGGYWVLFAGSLFAYYRAGKYVKKEDALRISLKCLFFCALAYAVYPAVAGKFWNYHYMPFAFFLTLSISLLLFPELASFKKTPVSSDKLKPFQVALPVFVFIAVVSIQPFGKFAEMLEADVHPVYPAHSPVKGRVDEIAAWLKENLNEGDTVQPLDWTGGSIHAMLLSEAKIATKFMYDYHFYHHISLPYIQRLRKSFMEQMRKTKPRFIIEVHKNKPWVSGDETTREFPELRKFVNDNYSIVFGGAGYLIYERTTNRRGHETASSERNSLLSLKKNPTN